MVFLKQFREWKHNTRVRCEGRGCDYTDEKIVMEPRGRFRMQRRMHTTKHIGFEKLLDSLCRYS